jgi:hypothetical protein
MPGCTVAGERSAARDRQWRAHRRGAMSHAAGAAKMRPATTTIGIDIASSPRSVGEVTIQQGLHQKKQHSSLSRLARQLLCASWFRLARATLGFHYSCRINSCRATVVPCDSGHRPKRDTSPHRPKDRACNSAVSTDASGEKSLIVRARLIDCRALGLRF